MNCVEITKLLLKPEIWSLSGRLFPDELQSEAHDLRFYSDYTVAFRKLSEDKVAYKVPFFVWLWLKPLAWWTYQKVLKRNQKEMEEAV